MSKNQICFISICIILLFYAGPLHSLQPSYKDGKTAANVLTFIHGAEGSDADAKADPDKNILSNPTLIWFLVGLVLAFLEFAVPGVILVFFGAAAWIVAFTAYIGLTSTIESQLLTFIVASILLLVFLRRWVKGKFHGHVRDVQDPSRNLDEFTGKDVLVLEDVLPGKTGGYVEFKGASWSAVSEETIHKGDLAVIIGLDGLTLKIKKKGSE
ncbi:MAG: NfeD family protein [Deltaproteobacteria bacterium]|nr:NfeD family protein [Deltaproteobacteria bacterium]